MNDLMKEERERLKSRSPGDRKQVKTLFGVSTGVLLLGSWVVSAQLFMWFFRQPNNPYALTSSLGAIIPLVGCTIASIWIFRRWFYDDDGSPI